LVKYIVTDAKRGHDFCVHYCRFEMCKRTADLRILPLQKPWHPHKENTNTNQQINIHALPPISPSHTHTPTHTHLIPATHTKKTQTDIWSVSLRLPLHATAIVMSLRLPLHTNHKYTYFDVSSPATPLHATAILMSLRLPLHKTKDNTNTNHTPTQRQHKHKP
jgi:hypothetical protein